MCLPDCSFLSGCSAIDGSSPGKHICTYNTLTLKTKAGHKYALENFMLVVCRTSPKFVKNIMRMLDIADRYGEGIKRVNFLLLCKIWTDEYIHSEARVLHRF